MFQKFLVFSQVLLAVIYCSAGLSKLVSWFPNIIGPVWLIDELAKHNLELFGYFIAVSQTVVGTLLFFQKFRLVAAIMLLPMHLCITVVPISLGWQGTPYVNSVLLIMILTLLFDDRKRLAMLLSSSVRSMSKSDKIMYWSCFVLFWFTAFYLRYGFAL